MNLDRPTGGLQKAEGAGIVAIRLCHLEALVLLDGRFRAYSRQCGTNGHRDGWLRHLWLYPQQHIQGCIGNAADWRGSGVGQHDHSGVLFGNQDNIRYESRVVAVVVNDAATTVGAEEPPQPDCFLPVLLVRPHVWLPQQVVALRLEDLFALEAPTVQVGDCPLAHLLDSTGPTSRRCCCCSSWPV